MSREAPFAQEVCQRLPLAEAVLRCLDHVFDEEQLDSIFERHRGRCYEDTIRFPTMVSLIAEALLERDGAALPGFQRAQEDGQIEACIRAHYSKMGRLPVALSAALLHEGTDRLLEVFPPNVARDVPESLHDFEIHFADGKKVKNLSKRLGELRNLRGHIIGGKVLAALDAKTGLVRALSAHPDGEVSDNVLLEPLLQTFEGIEPSAPRLWVMDRAFSDLVVLERLSKRGDHFLIRHNQKLKFHPDPEVPSEQGVTPEGLVYVQRWGWVGSPEDPRRRRVRQIHLYRPDGDDVILLTDLLDPQKHPAADLLQLYRSRWGIEEVFQQVVEVFHLQRLISSTPQGTIFQASFCCLIYNLVQLIRGYLAQGQQRPIETISTEKIFDDVQRQLISWHEVLDVEATVQLLRDRPTADLRTELQRLLHPLWKERWLKAPKKKPKKDKPPSQYVPGGHTSVFRVLRNQKGKPG